MRKLVVQLFEMESRKKSQFVFVVYQCCQCHRCFYHRHCEQPTHHLTCGPLVCGIVEGTAKEELCVKCFLELTGNGIAQHLHKLAGAVNAERRD